MKYSQILIDDRDLVVKTLGQNFFNFMQKLSTSSDTGTTFLGHNTTIDIWANDW
jgi:hypothetical protein